MENEEHVCLSQEDRDAIVDGLYRKLKHEFYLNTGKGVVNIALKLIAVALGGLMVVGYSKGWFG